MAVVVLGGRRSRRGQMLAQPSELRRLGYDRSSSCCRQPRRAAGPARRRERRRPAASIPARSAARATRQTARAFEPGPRFASVNSACHAPRRVTGAAGTAALLPRGGHRCQQRRSQQFRHQRNASNCVAWPQARFTHVPHTSPSARRVAVPLRQRELRGHLPRRGNGCQQPVVLRHQSTRRILRRLAADADSQ